MRTAVMLTAAAGCFLLALFAGKSPAADWSDVLTSVLFAAAAGALLAAAG